MGGFRFRGVGIVGMVMALTVPIGHAAWAVPGAPAQLTVTRTGADRSDLQVQWSAVSGVDHYTVTVFDGNQDNAAVVPAGTTSYVFDGTGSCTRYRVRVSAVKPDGQTATTGDYWVPALAPGAVTQLRWNGKGDGEPSKLTWAPPSVRSEYPVTGYAVRVTAVATGDQVLEQTVTDTSMGIPGLLPNRVYKARVQALNAFGTCASPTLLLRGAKSTMTPPHGLVVRRDAAVPSTIDVSWKAPEWTGAAEVTGYEVSASDGKSTLWRLVPGADITSTEMSVDPAKNWEFRVRAVGSGRASDLSKPVTMAKVGATGEPELDPAVTITTSKAKVVVTVAGPVGSNRKYPALDVRISPTVTGGFSDHHAVSNRATKVVFGDVPCGVYTVQVTGRGEAGVKEFGRSIISRCSSHTMTADDWQVVSGKADIAGTKVSIVGPARVLAVKPRDTQDAVFASDVDFQRGMGWGLWTRAVVDGARVNSGYAFQYDPALSNRFVIKVWSADNECGSLIGEAKFPEGLKIYGTHRVVVVVNGDSLYATIDGVRLFDVPSLHAGLTKSHCSMPEPRGTQVALRTWSGDTIISFSNTTLD